MMSFAQRVQELKLTKKSDFPLIAQEVIKTYYRRPYPGKKDHGRVNRPYHGGVHASQTANNLEMFFELYKKYKPELLRHPLTDHELTQDDLLLLKLAALYHDSANVSETMGWEKDHADNFRHDMALLGWKKEDIEPYAMAIQEKDKTFSKNILQKLIHDADCLDIIRIVGRKFDKTQLDIRLDLDACPGFLGELDQIIENHFDTIAYFKKNPGVDFIGAVHKECELAENCYLAVIDFYKTIVKNQIISMCAAFKKTVLPSQIDLSTLGILDYYNRDNSLKIKKIMEDLSVKLEDMEIIVEEDPLKKLFEQGCLVRVIDSDKIDNELKILERNALSLEKLKDPGDARLDQIEEELTILKKDLASLKKTEGLTVAEIADMEMTDRSLDSLKIEAQSVKKIERSTTAKLVDYIAAQAEEGKKVFTPPEFKWRPCSLYQAHIPVEFFGVSRKNFLALIIDPAREKGTTLCYFYKENVTSEHTKSGYFKYEPQKGSYKNKKTLAILKDKQWEQERRRRGLEVDPGLKYFGQESIKWSEVLGTYESRGIAGLIAKKNKGSLRSALMFRNKLGRADCPIYHYSIEKGMEFLSEKEILAQLNPLMIEAKEMPMVTIHTKASFEEVIREINQAITTILQTKPAKFELSDYTASIKTISYQSGSSKELNDWVLDYIKYLKSSYPSQLIIAKGKEDDLQIKIIEVLEMSAMTLLCQFKKYLPSIDPKEVIKIKQPDVSDIAHVRRQPDNQFEFMHPLIT